jgi:polysaccharide biosynthesis protein PslJ
VTAEPLLGPAPAAGTALSGDPVAGATVTQRKLLALGLAGCVVIALGAAVTDFYSTTVLVAMTGLLVLLAWQRYLLAWPTLLAYVILVLLFIPIRRFTVGGGLPISLEPYRLLVALVIAGWALAVLADPRVRWRSTGFDGPIILFAIVAVASIAVNIGWIHDTGITGAVLKQVSIFASLLLTMFFVSSVITSRRQIDGILMLLVLGGAAVAVATLYEWRTSQNLFNDMDRYIPILRPDPARILESDARGGRVRAFASAEHPIALGAMLVLLMPLAVYLYQRKRQPVWLGAAGLLVFGALATGSRTAAGMLAVLLVTFFWMKRKETLHLLPLLLPLFVACQIVMPGTLGTFKAIIFPEGGSVIQEQKGGQGDGEGRVADLGPSLEEWSRRPFLGQGFGSRLTSNSDPLVNARILDNQWLATLLEVGAFGALSLVWLFVRAVRMLARRSRNDATPYGWLLATLGASITAFAFGMFTYDAFSFIQVTFISFILLGLAAAALRLDPAKERTATPASAAP